MYAYRHKYWQRIILKSIEVGNEALVTSSIALDKGIGNSNSVGIVYKLTILCLRNPAIKWSLKPCKGCILVHKAIIHIIAKGGKQTIKGEFSLGSMRWQEQQANNHTALN